MATTTVGFDGTISEAQFARFIRAHDEVGYKHGVLSGFASSAGAGSREVSVTAGTAVMPGLLTDSDATSTKTFAANATGAVRVDFLVLRADWAANTVTLEVVQGSGPTAPALTQIEGDTWEMPLARVSVRPAVATFLSTDVVVCKPLPRVVQSVTAGLTAVNRAWNSADFTVATVTLPDPGWPYRLHLVSSAVFYGGTGFNGYGVVSVVANGSTVGSDGSDALVQAGSHRARVTRTTGILTGPVTALAQIRPSNMTSASSLSLLSAYTNCFVVDLYPA